MSLWKVVWMQRNVSRARSFNPCFGGCRSERNQREHRLALRWLFQSLFWWMSLWKGLVSSVFLSNLLGFNPCFGGCRSESYGFIGYTNKYRKFQSLFWWMSLWKRERAERNRRKNRVSILVLVDVALKGGSRQRWQNGVTSFNPCFGGCRSERV